MVHVVREFLLAEHERDFIGRVEVAVNFDRAAERGRVFCRGQLHLARHHHVVDQDRHLRLNCNRSEVLLIREAPATRDWKRTTPHQSLAVFP